MTDSYNAIADEIRQLFINATAHTLSVQCNVKSTHTGSFQKGKQEQQPFDIGGIIGITSPNIKGTATLCFPKAIFLQIIQSMFDETTNEISKENEDTAAELLNIIFGHVKTLLNKKGHDFEMALPSVVHGSQIKASYDKTQEVTVLSFKTDKGEFYIEVLLKALEKKEKEEALYASQKESSFTPAEKAAFFVPFIHGTISSLKVQCNIDAKANKPFNKTEANNLPFDIAGIVGITSKTINGTYSIVFKEAVFLKLASKMFDENITTLQPGIEDLVAELVNITLGSAKQQLNAQGHGIQMAIPAVIKGSNVRTAGPRSHRVIVVPFESEIGNFHVEIDIQT